MACGVLFHSYCCIVFLFFFFFVFASFNIVALRGIDTLSGEITLSRLFFLPSEKGSIKIVFASF